MAINYINILVISPEKLEDFKKDLVGVKMNNLLGKEKNEKFSRIIV